MICPSSVTPFTWHTFFSRLMMTSQAALPLLSPLYQWLAFMWLKLVSAMITVTCWLCMMVGQFPCGVWPTTTYLTPLSFRYFRRLSGYCSGMLIGVTHLQYTTVGHTEAGVP